MSKENENQEEDVDETVEEDAVEEPGFLELAEVPSARARHVKHPMQAKLQAKPRDGAAGGDARDSSEDGDAEAEKAQD